MYKRQVPINNTALEDGTVIRTYALNLGSREYNLQPILQQVRELMDRQSIRWYSQTQVNADSLFGSSEIGPLTDVLNEAFAEVTHQNLITGVGHMSIASNSLLSVGSSYNVAHGCPALWEVDRSELSADQRSDLATFEEDYYNDPQYTVPNRSLPGCDLLVAGNRNGDGQAPVASASVSDPQNSASLIFGTGTGSEPHHSAVANETCQLNHA